MTTHQKTISFVVGVMLGVVVGFTSSFASEIAVVMIVLAIAQGSLIVTRTVAERTQNDAEKKRSGAVGTAPLFTLLLTAGIALGILRVQLVIEPNTFVCDSACTFDARVVTSAQVKDAYQTFYVQPLQEDTQSSEMYGVQVRTALYPKYEVGDTIRITGKVTEPHTLPLHGNTRSSARVGQFDYLSYLHTRDVGSEVLFPKIEVIDTQTHTMSDTLMRMKDSLVERLSHFVTSPANELASGMLFGTVALSKTILDEVRIAGLSHIIVLSGFNIAIVISFILFVFAFAPLYVRVAIASLSVLAFVIAVGGGVSVIRATLMAFIALLALTIGRAYIARQALLISLFLIIMYDPHSLLFDVSLHLSFLATAGIVYGSDVVDQLLNQYVRNVSLRGLITTTLVAYLATLPYILYTFGMLSMYSLIANMLVLPFVPLMMLLASLVIALSFVSHTLALVIGVFVSGLGDAMLFVVHIIASLPFAQVTFSISSVTMFGMYAFLIIMILYTRYRGEEKTREELLNAKHDPYLTDIIPY